MEVLGIEGVADPALAAAYCGRHHVMGLGPPIPRDIDGAMGRGAREFLWGRPLSWGQAGLKLLAAGANG